MGQKQYGEVTGQSKKISTVQHCGRTCSVPDLPEHKALLVK